MLTKIYEGKVRDVYTANGNLFLVATDRLSAFDRVLGTVRGKGELISKQSAYWFQETRHLVPNHFVDLVAGRVTVARPATIFPIEFVVRGFLTGVTKTSLWTAYQKGERNFYGHKLPDNLKKGSELAHPILTPTTKSKAGDRNAAKENLIAAELITEGQWDEVVGVALKLFAFGQRHARERGLVLVDTKYEFGMDADGKAMLCDELHTCDSSRYWRVEDYGRFLTSGDPSDLVAYDKECFRAWLDGQLKSGLRPEEINLEKGPVKVLLERYRIVLERLTQQPWVAEAELDGEGVGKPTQNLLRKKGYL